MNVDILIRYVCWHTTQSVHNNCIVYVFGDYSFSFFRFNIENLIHKLYDSSMNILNGGEWKNNHNINGIESESFER